jgi:hypothetical protein
MTTKEKLLKAIDNLPDEKIKEVYKLLNSLKVNKKDVKRLKTFNLGGKFDNMNVRKAAYEKNTD